MLRCRLWRGVCERCKCCGVCKAMLHGVCMIGVSVVVFARLPFFDVEPFAMLSGKAPLSGVDALPWLMQASRVPTSHAGGNCNL